MHKNVCYLLYVLMQYIIETRELKSQKLVLIYLLMSPDQLLKHTTNYTRDKFIFHHSAFLTPVLWKNNNIKNK